MNSAKCVKNVASAFVVQHVMFVKPSSAGGHHLAVFFLCQTGFS
jgi:hypothetical protein